MFSEDKITNTFELMYDNPTKSTMKEIGNGLKLVPMKRKMNLNPVAQQLPISRICSLPLSKPSISMRNCVFSRLLDSCSPSDLRCNKLYALNEEKTTISCYLNNSFNFFYRFI